jgi:predicted dehydrogenase
MAEPLAASPAAAAAPLQVGLIGFGYWGRKLGKALRACPRIDLARMHVRSPGRLDADELKLLEGVKISDRRAELLDDPNLQAVIIATPTASHYDLCRQALLSGKHVLVEKPLALTSIQARELASMAHSRGLTLQTDYTWTFSPGLARARQVVEQGWLGDLRHIQLRFHQLGRFRSDDVGPLVAVHMLSILGMFTDLGSMQWTRHTGHGTDRRATSVLLIGEEPTSGLSVLLDGSLDDPVRERAVLLLGEQGSLSFRPLSTGPTLEGVRYSREPSRDDVVRPSTSMSLSTAEDDNLGLSILAFAAAVAGTAASNTEQSVAITTALERLFDPAGKA